jgi:hypothetical protein
VRDGDAIVLVHAAILFRGVPRGGSFFLDILFAEQENDPKQICKKILFEPTRTRT